MIIFPIIRSITTCANIVIIILVIIRLVLAQHSGIGGRRNCCLLSNSALPSNKLQNMHTRKILKCITFLTGKTTKKFCNVKGAMKMELCRMILQS